MNVYGWSSCHPSWPARCLRLFPTQLPTGVAFVQRAGLVTDGSPAEFEALAGRLPVFRIDPIT
jgi:hypothetical protein